MESAWQDGMYECDGDGTFEDFYKTFNTKGDGAIGLNYSLGQIITK